MWLKNANETLYACEVGEKEKFSLNPTSHKRNLFEFFDLKRFKNLSETKKDFKNVYSILVFFSLDIRWSKSL